jgi:hypothetical protein
MEYSLTVRSVFLLAAKVKDAIAADDLESSHPILEEREGTMHHLRSSLALTFSTHYIQE